MYDVTIFSNTGFGGCNVPASPSVLYSVGSHASFPSIDLLQDDGLTSISVRAKYADVKKADYVKVGDVYYQVAQTPTMTSYDVAVIPLVADYLLTCGGAASLTYTAGITTRLKSSSNEWADFPEHDDYLAPAKPLELKMGSYVYGGNSGFSTVVESTIDLISLGKQFDSSGKFKGTGITFTDTGSSTEGEESYTVTVPYTEGVPNHSNYYLDNYSTTSPGTKLYLASNDTVQKGIAACRALGVTNAIISQVNYPTSLITVSATSDGAVTSVTGNSQSSASSSLPYVYNSSAPMVLNYSDYCKYGLISCSGSKMECTPLQLSSVSSSGSPSVSVKSDPRPTGKTYFRFAELQGDSTAAGFWIGAVDGSPWASVPLVWTEPNGSYQTQINYSFNSQMQSTKHAESLQRTGLEAANNLISGAMSLVSGKGDYNFTDLFTKSAEQQISQYYYDANKQQEMRQFAISQTVVQPDVQCPFTADALRDFYGNGCFTYRLVYNGYDITRLTRIIKYFGNKYVGKVNADMFANNTDGFAYVEATGINVTADIPKRWIDGINAQMSSGVRVWYKKPVGV